MIHRQFMVYVGVGVVSALIDIGIMEGLIRLGLHYGVATSLGFAAGLVFNYLAHARVTFKASRSLSTAFRYGVLVMANYLITLALVIAFQRWLGSPLIGKVVSLPIIAISGFLWSRYWVFRQ